MYFEKRLKKLNEMSLFIKKCEDELDKILNDNPQLKIGVEQEIERRKYNESKEGDYIMNKLEFTFRGSLTIEGAEEHLFDEVCGKFDSNIKDIITTTPVEDIYRKFTVTLENGYNLDCKILFDSSNKEWNCTVLIIE